MQIAREKILRKLKKITNKMAETSKLSKIENVPDHPMQMFNDVLTETDKTQVSPFNLMCVASVNEEKGVLNRNVILVKHDDDGFVFITERNSQKYKDFIKNPAAAATFLWCYPNGNHIIYRQVRINGHITELSRPDIAELYKSFPLHAKIRNKICNSGEPVDWNALKKEHDQVLKAYQDGTELLEQNEHFTAMRLCPNDIDFYYTKLNEIADRVLYTKQANGRWTNQHISA